MTLNYRSFGPNLPSGRLLLQSAVSINLVSFPMCFQSNVKHSYFILTMHRYFLLLILTFLCSFAKQTSATNGGAISAIVDVVHEEIEPADYQKELIREMQKIACSIEAKYLSVMIDVRVSWAFTRDVIKSLSVCSLKSGILIYRCVHIDSKRMRNTHREFKTISTSPSQIQFEQRS